MPNFFVCMKFRFLKGNNNRDFVVMSEMSVSPPPLRKDDVYRCVKSCLERKEYKPFMTKSFDKYIRASYLFNGNVFPYTLWEDVKSKLRQLGVKPSDMVLSGEPDQSFVISKEEFDDWLGNVHVPDEMKISEEYDFQPESVFRALNKRTARIMVATSGGKTFITYLYCRFLVDFRERLGINKILIIVPAKLLCNQLVNDFKEYDVWYRDNDVSPLTVSPIYGGSKQVADANVVCGTYQSLCQYDREYFDDFDVVICDELHRAKAYSIRNEIYAKCLRTKFFFGMTGSEPEYKSLDYLHITSMFGPEVMRVDASEAIDRGISNNVSVNQIVIDYYVGDRRVTRIRDLIDVPEEYCDGDNVNYNAIYQLEKEFFQSREDRLMILSRFLSRFRETSIVLVDTVEYCHVIENYLRRVLPSEMCVEVIHGSVSDKKRQQIIDEARRSTENYVIVATYGTMSTGVSIKSLTNLYIVDGGKSGTRIRQSVGRVMRVLEGKSKSRVFDFKDNITHSSFYRQAREREKIYRENLGFVVNMFNTRVNV